MKQLFTSLACFLCMFTSSFGQDLNVSSPNGQLNVTVSLDGRIEYSVTLNNQAIFNKNTLGLHLKEQVLGENPKLKNYKITAVNEDFSPVVPLKYSSINNQYNLLKINFKGGYDVEFRVYNEGVAYRFITHLKNEIEVEKEDIVINLPEKYIAHLQQTDSFKTSYENPYSHVPTTDFTNGLDNSTLPVLLENENYKILIAESDLKDYPGMFLNVEQPNQLTGVFPFNPVEFEDEGDRSMKIIERANYIAKTEGSREFPWRYFLITQDDSEILKNTLTQKLASPNALKNTSWIKPGQVSWEWWNGASPYHVDFVAGFNEETYKYFIDFASEFNIPYIIMDEGWAQSTTDPYTPNPDIDLFELINYAKAKNVKIVLWLTWLTVEHNFDLFKTFSEWGIAGVKIDFMDRSDQWMVNFYERVAKEAAKNQLFVDFHGAFKPSGLSSVYPNVLSYEGVLGLEQMGRAVPDNSIYLPFMRNAVGPMDFTPGAMINMQPEHYYSERPNSAGVGTRAFQMALFVVFESGLQMLADNPTNYYRERECTDFITSVPTTWEETRVLKAKIGEYVLVAKRKGNKWFIGGMANSKGQREFTIKMDFLDENESFTMTSFKDGVNAGTQAMDYKKTVETIEANQEYKITMVKNGGFAAIITIAQ
ncbi:glycoside hydrolase family 97 protein [Leeuwenhoekiella sp. A16]|uniref:glycoside hydrolase family 97 protein n=1 Tax=unclassified Leeuwenhoekiella TaxID=2615029 RepID=UPI003A806BA9